VAELFFYVLSLLCLAGAAGVVLAKSPMVSVLSLLASFFCLAVIYLLAGFQFMAAAQVLVYAGAILVLFLFVIMLLDLGSQGGAGLELLRGLFDAPRGRIAAVLAVGLALVGLITAQRAALPPAGGAAMPEGIDRVGDLAVALFGRYGLAFEAASLLLLATMVAVIVLAKRQRGSRRQGPQGRGPGGGA